MTAKLRLLLVLFCSLICASGITHAQEPLSYVQWSSFPDIISAKTSNEIVLLSPELEEIDRWRIIDDSAEQSILYYAWSPDGSRLAVMLQPYAVQLWDVATRQCIATIPDAYPYFLEWSYNSQYLAVEYFSFPNVEVGIIEGDDGDIAYEWSISVSALTWHPQALQLATIIDSVEVWDVNNFPPQPIAKLTEAYSSVGVAYSPTGDRIVFNPRDEYESLGIYDPQTLQRLQIINTGDPNQTGFISSVSWGNAPLTVLFGRNVSVWNPDTGNMLWQVSDLGTKPGDLAYLPSWNPDGTAFVYNDAEIGIHIRDGRTGEILARMDDKVPEMP